MNLYGDMGLSWTLDPGVEGFEKETFFNRDGTRGRKMISLSRGEWRRIWM